MKRIFILLIVCCSCSNKTSKEYLELSDKEIKMELKIEYCDKAIEANPKNIDAYYKRGRLYRSFGIYIRDEKKQGMTYTVTDISNFNKALQDFQKILLLNKKESDAQSLIGFTYLDMRDTIKGCNELNTAARMGNEEAKKKIQKSCN